MSYQLIPQHEAENIGREVTSLEQQTAEITISDERSVKIATDMLGQISKTKKAIEERRQFFVKPLNEQVRKINAWFKEITKPLAVAEKTLKKKILNYRHEQERKRREEEERMRKLLEKEQKKMKKKALKNGDPIPPPIPIPAVPKQEKTITSNTAQITARAVWDFEIEDETKIPREFLTVNEKAIRAAVKAGVRNIPGVRIFQREELAVKGL